MMRKIMITMTTKSKKHPTMRRIERYKRSKKS